MILLAAAALRLPHLRGPLDEPHAWRQADTAQYARAFYDEGLDLLHPSVDWLGLHKTLVLEFPLPEALMALGYHATGGEHLPIARAITLAFFLGAGAYLFLFVRLLFDVRVAAVTTGVFCLLPLGLYYSRAVHADPAALMFAHATVYHALRALDGGRMRHYVGVAVWATLAALVKVPYVFYFALPVTVYAAKAFDLRRYAGLALAGLPAIVAMILWREHATAVNETVPDWSFIPRFAQDFSKHATGSAEWFFGEPAMRWDPHAWGTILHRVRASAAGPLGSLLSIVGLVATPLASRRWGWRPVGFVLAWVGGVVIYVLIFMGLNVIHDYYQMPLLATVAVLSAIALEVLRAETARLSPAGAWLLLGATLVVMGAHSLRAAERRYYVLDTPRIEAGALVRAHTPRDALVIASVSGSERTDDPRLLYRADRYGWAVPPDELSPDLITRMRTMGASFLVVVLRGKPGPGLADIQRMIPAQEFPLRRAPWRAMLFDLRQEAAR